MENVSSALGFMREDFVKESLKQWLTSDGWTTNIAWGKTQGIDVEAKKAGGRWLIEAKGEGVIPQACRNSFFTVLGDILQRMNDPTAKYSIALPDTKVFRNLWQRLPTTAKDRLQLSLLLVDDQGKVTHLDQIPATK